MTMRDRKLWNVSSSIYAKDTFNPIRSIVENLHIVPNSEKHMIALSIGDPTVFGNLKPAKEITEALVESIQSFKYNGYAPSTGIVEARAAVAKYCSVPGLELEAKDIVLCSGCSCALDLCITALCSPGQNILVPRPGFPLYRTLAEGLSIKTKHYDLMPEKNWEVNLAMLEDTIDENTAAIVINNPSNPCGSVYSAQHLRAILDVASRNKVPIIADEIYDHFVFEGQEYQSVASLTKDVPVLSCGGLTKRFLVPGWRMGWIAICDRGNVLEKEVRKGLHSLSQRIIGTNTLVQGALPTILSTTPKAFFADTIAHIQANAQLCYAMFKAVPGLHPIMPQGAMYMMVGVDMACFPCSDDLQFVEQMISEESVFCLPGKCFNYPNYVRVVLTVPEVQLREACARIADFCKRHYHHRAAHDTPIAINGSPYDVCNGSSHEYNGIATAEEVKALAKAATIDPVSLVSEMEVE